MATQIQQKFSPKPRRKIWPWLFGCFGGLILIASVFLNIILIGILFSKNISYKQFGSALEETIIEGKKESKEKKEKIVLIDIKGGIFFENETLRSVVSQTSGVEFILKQINQATKDPNVKGMMLNINSPGGSVSAADEVYHRLNLAKKAGKKIVTYYSGTGASGAYYLALPSDKIFANPTALTGSVGVIAQVVNAEELLKKIGVKAYTIKSGKYKDILSTTRPMTDEEKKIVQSMIDEYQKRFIDLIKKNRKISQQNLDKIAEANIFVAPEAKEIGLIDETGYFDDALNEMVRLTGIKEFTVIKYKEPFSLRSIFTPMDYLIKNFITDKINQLLTLDQPKIMYLWK